MSSAPSEQGLSRAFDRAVADYFGGPAEEVDAEEVMVASCTVAGRYIAGVRDPVSRGVLLAQAQWLLRRMVVEVVRAGVAKAKPGGGQPDGT